MSNLEQLKNGNEELKTKLSELQPFERGTEGWGLDYKEWVECKYLTFGLDGRHCVHVSGCENGAMYVDDFTTENPHKKETVVYIGDNPHRQEEFNNWVQDSFIYILDNTDGLCISIYSVGVGYSEFYIAQLGDDLKAKFDDPNNEKYIDLTK